MRPAGRGFKAMPPLMGCSEARRRAVALADRNFNGLATSEVVNSLKFAREGARGR